MSAPSLASGSHGGHASSARSELPRPLAVSVYDVLRGSDVTFMQILIIVYGFISYSQCINHVMITTLSQSSLWEKWPELDADHVKYNTVIAGQAFARLLGNFYIMPLMDYYGRRNLFLVCNILPLFATIGSAFAPNFIVYAIFRCIAVCLATTAGIAANVYVIEIVNPKLRPTINWLQQAYGCVGLIYMVGCKWLLEHHGTTVWNWLQFYTHLPTLIGIIIGIATHIEAPGYEILYSPNGAAKAWKTVQKVVGGPDKLDKILGSLARSDREQDNLLISNEVELVEAQVLVQTAEDAAAAPILGRRDVRFIEESFKSSERRSVWTFIDVRPVLRGWFRLLKRKQTRWDTIGLCVIWFGEAFCHWGIMSYCGVFYESVGYDANIMSVLVWAIEIPLHYLMLRIMSQLSNERLLIGVISAVAVALTLALGILMQLRNSSIIAGPDWIFGFLAVSVAITGGIVWGPVYAFSSERYPIKIRASAMGLFNGVDSIALVASSYLGSAVIAPATIQYMLYANTGLRLIVAVTTLTLVTTDVADQILDFDD